MSEIITVAGVEFSLGEEQKADSLLYNRERVVTIENEDVTSAIILDPKMFMQLVEAISRELGDTVRKISLASQDTTSKEILLTYFS